MENENKKYICSTCKKMLLSEETKFCEHCATSGCKRHGRYVFDSWICDECRKIMLETDLYLIEIDQTKYWNEEFLKNNKIKEIKTVYLFDKNSHTNCCEMTFSYWLQSLYINIINKDGITEEQKDKNINEANESFEEEGSYFNHYDIDKIIEKNETDVHKLNSHNFLYFKENEEWYNEHLEDVREECMSNHRL
jgi:hypothetical protein